MITAKVHGIEDVDRALSELPKSVASAVLRTALKKAGQPVAELAGAIAGTTTHTGTFAKSFLVHTVLSKRQKRAKKLRGDAKQQATVFVGSTDRKAHLIEFGTAPHELIATDAKVLASAEAVYGVAGSHPGTRPRPALRPAWDALQGAVLSTIGQEMWKAIDKARKRLARRAAKLAAQGN
jgi:HK97 gp10 family phage protein